MASTQDSQGVYPMPPAAPVIQMFSVTKRYGAQEALSQVSLEVFPGDFLFLTGPSGAGKSTFLRLLYLAETASTGQILMLGMNLNRVPARGMPGLRRQIGVVFQDFKLIPTRTVFDNVALVLEVAGMDPKTTKKKVRALLRWVGMEKKMNALPPTLSGGEQQRVAVARAVCGEPKIILADEPTGSLDAESAQYIMELFKLHHQRGAAVILATHDRTLIPRQGARVAYLEQGRFREVSPGGVTVPHVEGS